MTKRIPFLTSRCSVPVNFGEVDGLVGASNSPLAIDVDDKFSREGKEHIRSKISDDWMEM
jgi:hypothetical protein